MPRNAANPSQTHTKLSVDRPQACGHCKPSCAPRRNRPQDLRSTFTWKIWKNPATVDCHTSCIHHRTKLSAEYGKTIREGRKWS